MKPMKLYHSILLVLLLTVLALSGAPSYQRAEAASVDPSWEIVSGPPGVCSGTNITLPGVIVLATSNASEQGTLTAPGFGQIGYTQDSNFVGSGTFGFTVFTGGAYSVPANTPLTLTVTTYSGPNYTGEVSFISSLTWDCTSGATISRFNSTGVGGCDTQMAIPSTAVGGTFVTNAPVYWAPGELVDPAITLEAGKSARVIGLDASGQYYKIIWECDYLWVPANTLGPNFDAVWQGRPLPTDVVE